MGSFSRACSATSPARKTQREISRRTSARFSKDSSRSLDSQGEPPIHSPAGREERMAENLNWIALDAGGTMTDAVIVGEEGNFLVGKFLTNKQDESASFIGSIADATKTAALDMRQTLAASEVIVYAGTIMLNTLLSRTGANVGLMITQGFEDYLL